MFLNIFSLFRQWGISNFRRAAQPTCTQMTAHATATRILRVVLKILPSPLAFSLTASLANRPPRLSLKPRDEALLATGTSSVWRMGDHACAWAWGDKGPLVILVHGWGGGASQMAPMARFLSLQGYRAVVFDMTAHGSSRRARVDFDQLIEDVISFAGRYAGHVHAFVGHSAGGLCTMAARDADKVQARHFVCLNAPRSPYVPIDMIKRTLGTSPAVEMRLQTHFAKPFGRDWQALDACGLFKRPDDSGLHLFYDRDDELVHFEDGDKIRRSWPSATVTLTSGLGHHRILKEEAVWRDVADAIRV